MARARRSNQRPDTLMQDRYRQLDEILLLRTAGPYIGSLSDVAAAFDHVRSTLQSRHAAKRTRSRDRVSASDTPVTRRMLVEIASPRHRLRSALRARPPRRRTRMAPHKRSTPTCLPSGTVRAATPGSSAGTHRYHTHAGDGHLTRPCRGARRRTGAG
jgi:hypothetical protein